MPPSATFLLGAAVCLTAASPYARISPALADPSYTADNVVNIFLKDKAAKAERKTRGICIGTAAECPTPKAPPQANFDLLANFDFNSDKLTQMAKENLDQFAKALQDPRLKGEKFRDRRPYRRDRHRGIQSGSFGTPRERSRLLPGDARARPVSVGSQRLWKDETARRQSLQPGEPSGRNPFDGVNGFVLESGGSSLSFRALIGAAAGICA